MLFQGDSGKSSGILRKWQKITKAEMRKKVIRAKQKALKPSSFKA